MTPPTSIRLRRSSRILEVGYADGARFELPLEYLRVFSPSAEVRGHGGGEPALVGGKRNVNVERVEPVGQYAVRLVFDDGHNTGLYSWDVFEDLGRNYAANWARYLQRLAEMKMSRDSEVVTLAALQPKKWTPPK
jgi:DUF971 family protein